MDSFSPQVCDEWRILLHLSQDQNVPPKTLVSPNELIPLYEIRITCDLQNLFIVGLLLAMKPIVSHCIVGSRVLDIHVLPKYLRPNHAIFDRHMVGNGSSLGLMQLFG